MTIAVLRKVDNQNVASALEEVQKSLNRAQGEVVLDFSSVARLDGIALSSLKVILRGVNVNVYKVLVLMKLTSRFSFVN
jgi:hypothetical protein